jgi:hypothetical protein
MTVLRPIHGKVFSGVLFSLRACNGRPSINQVPVLTINAQLAAPLKQKNFNREIPEICEQIHVPFRVFCVFRG